MREQVSEEVMRERVKQTQIDLLVRIRQFFALGNEPAGDVWSKSCQRPA